MKKSTFDLSSINLKKTKKNLKLNNFLTVSEQFLRAC